METSRLDGSLRSQAERSTTFAALKCKKQQDVTCTNLKNLNSVQINTASVASPRVQPARSSTGVLAQSGREKVLFTERPSYTFYLLIIKLQFN